MHVIPILAALLLQDAPDKLDKKSPAEAVKLIVGEFKNVKAWGGQLKVTGAGGADIAYDSVVKKGACGATGAAEVYARKHKYAAKDGDGKFVAPDKIKGQAGAAAAGFVNPAMILEEALAAKPAKKWEADEEVDGKKLKVFTLEAAEQVAVAQAKTLMAKSDELKRYPGLEGRVDAKKTKSSYKVWVSGADLRVVRIEWALEPRLDLSGLPVPPGAQDQVDNFKATYALTLGKYNEELELKIPPDAEKLIK